MFLFIFIEWSTSQICQHTMREGRPEANLRSYPQICIPTLVQLGRNNFAIFLQNQQNLHLFFSFYLKNFFAYDFYKHVQSQVNSNDQNGWNVYDCKQEYERMGVNKTATGDWRFTNINQSFKFCETYPKLLVVPASTSDDDLRQIAQFRSKHRIPVVSWLKYDTRKNCVALLRSSQPLVGLPPQKRNEKDEAYLNTLFKMNTVNSQNKLYVMDARPLVNAVANRTTGGGYESLDNYNNCELVFLNIHNIHVMRESLRKIFDMAAPVSQSHASNMQQQQQQYNQNNAAAGVGGEATMGGLAANEEDKNFFVNLENSKWLEHIRSVLNGALKIVNQIHGQNTSVLVHCSDGWDRTAQVKIDIFSQYLISRFLFN
jgi:myotubularin-related protein 1/2